jgi:uncharacterized delta-60 repeat protein
MPIESLERRTLFAGVVLNEEITDFGESEVADAIESQRDGRSIVLGHIEGAADGGRLFLARYDIDGSLDTTFGENGRIFGEFDNFRRATSMTIDRAGRIIVAGVTTDDPADEDDQPGVAAMRFTRSGFLDRSFGDGGLATLDAGTGELIKDVAVDPSGRVIAVGQTLVESPGSSAATLGFLITRFESFGAADLTFGGDETLAIGTGFKTFTVGIGESGATSVALDGSHILVGGFGTEQEAGQPAESRFAIARLERFGTLDEDFGTRDEDGIVTVDFGGAGVAQDLALGRNGKIVAVGNTLPVDAVGGEQILVARFTRGGELDPAFGGGDGFTLAGFGGARSQIARQIAVDRSERVYVAGTVLDAGEPTGDLNDDQFLLARFLADGTPDETFAAGGAIINEVEQGLDSLEQVAGLTIQKEGKDGRVLVAGNAGTTLADQDLAVVRYATDATLGTGSAQVKGTKLIVRGTDRRDVITVSPDTAAGMINVNVNGAAQTFPIAGIKRIEVSARDGNDEVTCSVGGEIITTLNGGDDDDDLRLLGDARGRLEGDDGDDDLTGGDRADRLRGGDGDDILFGGDGNDDISGDDGFDELFGEEGDDELKADDGFEDELDGGGGDDEARVDFFDDYTRIDDVEFR